MATRLYLPSSGSAPASPAYDTAWTSTAIAARLPTSVNKASTSMTTVTLSGDTSRADETHLYRQYVSGPLFAQTINSGTTIKWQIRGYETNANNNLYTTISVRSWNTGGGGTFQTIISQTRDNTELIVSPSLQNRQFSATMPASVTLAEGDRLVIEIGIGGDPAQSGSDYHNSALRIGDASSSDLAENDTDSTNDYNGWVEFSQTLSFGFSVSGGDGAKVGDAGQVELGASTQVDVALADGIAVSDDRTVGGTFDLSRADGIATTDAYVLGGVINIAASEPPFGPPSKVAIVDTGRVACSIAAERWSRTAVSDAGAVDFVYGLAVADSATVADAYVLGGTINIAASEPPFGPPDKAAIDDTGKVALSLAPQRWSGIASTDAGTVALIAPVDLSVADMVAASDAYAGEKVYYAAVTISDAGTVTLVSPDAVGIAGADGIAGSDAYVLGGSFAVVVADAIAASEVSALGGSFGVAVADLVAGSDASVLGGSFALSRPDDAGVSDAGTVSLASAGDVNLTGADGIAVTDRYVADLWWFAGDAIAGSDSGAVALVGGDLNLTGADSIAISEAPVVGGAIAITGADVVAGSEAYAGEKLWYTGLYISDVGTVALVLEGTVLQSGTDSLVASDVGTVATDLVLVTLTGADTVAVSDSPTVGGSFDLVVADTATVSDAYAGRLRSYEPVFVSDVGTVQLITAEQVDLTVADTVAGSDSGRTELTPLEVVGTDRVAVSDTGTPGGTFALTRSDGVATTDASVLVLTPLLVAGADTVAVSEARTVGGSFALSRSDGTALSDAGTVGLSPIQVTVGDGLGVSDERATQLLAAGDVNLSRSDGIAVAEGVAVDLPGQTNLSVGDGVAVGDSRSLDLPGQTNLVVSDRAAVSDSGTVAGGTHYQSRADSAAVGDYGWLTLSPLSASRTDGIAVGDAASHQVQTVGDLTVSRTDYAALSDASTIALPGETWLTTIDALAVADAATVAFPQVPVSGADVGAVSDTGRVLLTPTLQHGADGGAVSDSGTVAFTSALVTLTGADGVAVGEASRTLLSPMLVAGADGVAVSDASTTWRDLVAPLTVSGTDRVAVSDVGDNAPSKQLLGTDRTALSDAGAILLTPLLLTVADAVTAKDYGKASSVAFYGVDFSGEAISTVGVINEALSGTGVANEALSGTGVTGETIKPV